MEVIDLTADDDVHVKILEELQQAAEAVNISNLAPTPEDNGLVQAAQGQTAMGDCEEKETEIEVNADPDMADLFDPESHSMLKDVEASNANHFDTQWPTWTGM